MHGMTSHFEPNLLAKQVNGNPGVTSKQIHIIIARIVMMATLASSVEFLVALTISRLIFCFKDLHESKPHLTKIYMYSLITIFPQASTLQTAVNRDFCLCIYRSVKSW